MNEYQFSVSNANGRFLFRTEWEDNLDRVQETQAELMHFVEEGMKVQKISRTKLRYHEDL